MKSYKTKRAIGNIIGYIILILISIIWLFPFVGLVLQSFRSYATEYGGMVDYLVPKQLQEHGIAKKSLRIDKAALAAIIDEYTHESGVRGLEKQIAKIARVTANGRPITLCGHPSIRSINIPAIPWIPYAPALSIASSVSR